MITPYRLAAVGSLLALAALAHREGPAWAAPARAGAAARATAAPTSPAAAIARLKKDEAGVKSGRITLLTVQRDGALPEGVRGSEAREAARRLPVAAQRREYLVFTGLDWRRDVTLTDPQGDVQAHYLLGVREHEGRVLEETGRGDEARRAGTIGIQPDLAPADRILLGRGSSLLDGVRWTGSKPAAGRLVLTGIRNDEKISVTLRTTPRFALERFVSEAEPLTPQGKVLQALELTAAYAPDGRALKTVEQLDYVTSPVSKVRLLTCTSEGTQVNAPVAAHDLEVAFPSGTRVTDRRVVPPVTYAQGDRDLTLAELKTRQATKGPAGARVGKPAPPWELKTLDGKTARLADYRGKVVLLTWFASW